MNFVSILLGLDALVGIVIAVRLIIEWVDWEDITLKWQLIPVCIVFPSMIAVLFFALIVAMLWFFITFIVDLLTCPS